jgi:hypothetical protein
MNRPLDITVISELLTYEDVVNILTTLSIRDYIIHSYYNRELIPEVAIHKAIRASDLCIIGDKSPYTRMAKSCCIAHHINMILMEYRNTYDYRIW